METSRSSQIEWSTAPPAEAREMAWPMIRVPAKGLAGAVILSIDMVGCATHYFGGRTVPHDPVNCKACDEQNQKRWHGYLAVWHPKTNRKGVLEITEAAGDTLVKARADRHSLRALSLTAERSPCKPNGKLIIRLAPSEWAADGLPLAPDLRRIMLRMWGLPYDDAEVDMHSAFSKRSNALKSNGRAH